MTDSYKSFYKSLFNARTTPKGYYGPQGPDPLFEVRQINFWDAGKNIKRCPGDILLHIKHFTTTRTSFSFHSDDFVPLKKLPQYCAELEFAGLTGAYEVLHEVLEDFESRKEQFRSTPDGGYIRPEKPLIIKFDHNVDPEAITEKYCAMGHSIPVFNAMLNRHTHGHSLPRPQPQPSRD